MIHTRATSRSGFIPELRKPLESKRREESSCRFPSPYNLTNHRNWIHQHLLPPSYTTGYEADPRAPREEAPAYTQPYTLQRVRSKVIYHTQEKDTAIQRGEFSHASFLNGVYIAGLKALQECVWLSSYKKLYGATHGARHGAVTQGIVNTTAMPESRSAAGSLGLTHTAGTTYIATH